MLSKKLPPRSATNKKDTKSRLTAKLEQIRESNDQNDEIIEAIDNTSNAGGSELDFGEINRNDNRRDTYNMGRTQAKANKMNRQT